MALRPSIVEHYKLQAEPYSHYTVHIQKVRRVEERVRWDHVEKIGWGSSGFVWLQERSSEAEGHKEQRAVKVLEKGMMKHMGIDYMKELEALTEFRMPRILQEEVLVNFYGWFEDKDKVFLAMEYFPLGDLERYISGNSITEQDTKDITVDLLKAVKLMHAEDFTHRDIKPKNILVLQNSPKWFIKLGDFGITKRISSAATALRTNTGTPLYSAPEIGFVGKDEDDVYTKAVDLWSVGCVVYHILAQRAPFETTQAKKKPFPTGHLIGRVSGDAINFLSKLLVLDPARRLAAAEALEHPWLVNVHPNESASGSKILSELATQMSLQSLGKQNSNTVSPRLSTDVEPRSNTDEGQVTRIPHSPSRRRTSIDSGFLMKTQEHRSLSVTQPEGYHRETQHTSNAGSGTAWEKPPPSSQIDKTKQLSEGQQRSASSTLPPTSCEIPPKTRGIQTEPSIVVNATGHVFTFRTPTAPALVEKRGTLIPKSSSSSAPSTLKETTLGKELREASEKGDIASVRDLVRDGVDVESIDPRDGLTAVHYASAFGHKNIVEFLLDSGANIHAHDTEKTTALHYATGEGHSDITRLLLDKKAVLDEEDERGCTPLHHAVENGHISVARELLEYGADINMQESNGFTALHIAAEKDYRDIVGLLLITDANTNLQNSEGSTALYIAAQNNFLDIVRLLLAANANVNMQISNGCTALHSAAQKNYWDIVSLLLAANADINLKEFEGRTALYLAANKDCKEVVKLLLAADATVDVQDSRGWTALHIATHKNYKDIVTLLLAANVDVNLYTDHGTTALHNATNNNCKVTVNLLLAANANINVQNSKGWTALHVAAQENYKDIVSLFLAAGADVTLVTEGGKTALHNAAIAGHVEVVYILLQTAVNVWAKNSRGKTALDLAKEKGYAQVIALLEKQPGDGKMHDKKADRPEKKEEGKEKAGQPFFSRRFV